MESYQVFVSYSCYALLLEREAEDAVSAWEEVWQRWAQWALAAQARVGRDFVKLDFLHFMIDPGLPGTSVCEGCQKTTSSRCLDVELQKRGKMCSY